MSPNIFIRTIKRTELRARFPNDPWEAEREFQRWLRELAQPKLRQAEGK